MKAYYRINNPLNKSISFCDLIVSEWSSQESFTAFIRSPEFQGVTAWGKAEILTARPKHTVYRTD